MRKYIGINYAIITLIYEAYMSRKFKPAVLLTCCPSFGHLSVFGLHRTTGPKLATFSIRHLHVLNVNS